MEMERDDFYLKVAHSLAGCQLVEQELKLYITEAFLLAKKCIGNQMPFKLSGDDYTNSSLEGLIKMFRKLSSNDELATALVAFKKERNFLSHNAIANCVDPDGQLSGIDDSELLAKLKNIETEAERLTSALNEEANKFRGNLYFDDLDATNENS